MSRIYKDTYVVLSCKVSNCGDDYRDSDANSELMPGGKSKLSKEKLYFQKIVQLENIWSLKINYIFKEYVWRQQKQSITDTVRQTTDKAFFMWCFASLTPQSYHPSCFPKTTGNHKVPTKVFNIYSTWERIEVRVAVLCCLVVCFFSKMVVN